MKSYIVVASFLLSSMNVSSVKNLNSRRNFVEYYSSNFEFKNSIVSGVKCNTFGYEQYVQNSDASAAYDVTLRVDQTNPGAPSSQFQKVVSVPAGGKAYAGCTASPGQGGPTYAYNVIGEVKK